MSDKSKKERAALLFEVHRVLVAETETATADRIRLRDAVCEFVFAEQRKGTSLSRMIQVIRETIKGAGDAAAISHPETTLAPTEDLARQLVEWCIQVQRSGGPITPMGPILLS
jgi:hypothetical protein